MVARQRDGHDRSHDNLAVAHDLALQNKQINQPVPVATWADFRVQERAMAALGRIS